MSIFRVKSVKIYTSQKNFTRGVRDKYQVWQFIGDTCKTQPDLRVLAHHTPWARSENVAANSKYLLIENTFTSMYTSSKHYWLFLKSYSSSVSIFFHFRQETSTVGASPARCSLSPLHRRTFRVSSHPLQPQHILMQQKLSSVFLERHTV